MVKGRKGEGGKGDREVGKGKQLDGMLKGGGERRGR